MLCKYALFVCFSRNESSCRGWVDPLDPAVCTPLTLSQLFCHRGMSLPSDNNLTTVHRRRDVAHNKGKIIVLTPISILTRHRQRRQCISDSLSWRHFCKVTTVLYLRDGVTVRRYHLKQRNSSNEHNLTSSSGDLVTGYRRFLRSQTKKLNLRKFDCFILKTHGGSTENFASTTEGTEGSSSWPSFNVEHTARYRKQSRREYETGNRAIYSIIDYPSIARRSEFRYLKCLSGEHWKMNSVQGMRIVGRCVKKIGQWPFWY